MKFTDRQQRIYNRLYDKLQSFRFTKISESTKAADLIDQIVLEIDAVVEDETKKRKEGK